MRFALRALTWALTLTIFCASATRASAQETRPIPKKVPRTCKPWSEALGKEIEKSTTCERQKASALREAITVTRAESKQALREAQRKIDAQSGALQEARRAQGVREKAHAQAIFDFSERNLAIGRALGVMKERERTRVNPLVWVGIGSGVTVVAVIVLRLALGGL